MNATYNECIASDGYKQFCSKGYEQIVENVCNDANLSDEAKQCFFEYLKNYDGSDVGTYFRKNFFRKRKLQNTPLSDFDYDEEIGHAMALSKFDKFWEKLFPDESEEVREENIRKFCCPYNSENSKSFKDYFQKFDDSKEINRTAKTGEGLMWTFKRLDGSTEVYDKEKYDKKDLPFLLGLEVLDTKGRKKKYVTFTLKVPRSHEVYKPTAFDAGLNTYWRPGGKTKKLDNAPARYPDIEGFDEFVHLPVCADDIQSFVYKLYDE